MGPSCRARRCWKGRPQARLFPATHAAFEPAPDRDPIAILAAQEADRLQDLVPLRHERMAESPPSPTTGARRPSWQWTCVDPPRTDILVQASGDAHISNFGLFASPERTLVFDANDFDETLPGPWEWDVKRLAVSVVIAGRTNGFSAAQNRAATMATVRSYRQWMARYAAMRLIDVWYAQITDLDIREAGEATGTLQGREGAARRARLEAIFTKARRRDGMRAFESLTSIVDGRRVLLDPPILTHLSDPSVAAILEKVFIDYRATMPENRRDFLERYRFVDFALKVVGVGSVGTRCYVVVLQGRDENDPLILQAKEATASIMEPYLPASGHQNHGQRVVVGQQLMQATSDIFLGWTRAPAGRDFYLRQLWDMKGSVDTTTLRPLGLGFYGGLCGWSLARAHARTGDAAAIAAYLGTSDTFDGAVAEFAETYADVNARDHAAYRKAIKAGTVSVPAAQ